MREILFRGKRVDNGEWIEGVPIKNEVGDMVIVESLFECEEYLCNGANAYYVDENSIGQYTGLIDKNDKKIFEGDIGRYKQTDGAKINGKPIICIGKVVYNEKTASFAVDSKDEIGAKNYDYFPIKDFEIIGNIYDNPELLRGEEE